MTMADKDGQWQTTSDSVSQRPTEADSVGQSPPKEKRSAAHTLTVLQVYEQFKGAGVIRSLRSIDRWAMQGRFDAALYSEGGGQQKYYITPESAEAVLTEEKGKDIDRGLLKAMPDSGGPAKTVTNEPADDQAKLEELRARVKELEHENLDIKASNIGYQTAVGNYQQQAKFFVEKLEALARENGKLEGQMAQLGAPKKEIHPEEGDVVKTTALSDKRDGPESAIENTQSEIRLEGSMDELSQDKSNESVEPTPSIYEEREP